MIKFMLNLFLYRTLKTEFMVNSHLPESLNDLHDTKLHTHIECTVTILQALLRISFHLFKQNIGVNGQGFVSEDLQ